MIETWKDIEDYEGLYQVSNLGRVLNVKRNTIRKPSYDKDGYLQLPLSKNGLRTYPKVHRLVAQAFISNPDNLPLINHKDENKQNNCASNLEWCTVEYNNTYGSRSGIGMRKIYKLDRISKAIIKQYKSISEAARDNKADASTIVHCLSGRRKSCVGYMWKYCD